VLSGSIEQRASFFFDLYDANSSGMLDLAEIGALLSLTRSGADDILKLGRAGSSADVDANGDSSEDDEPTHGLGLKQGSAFHSGKHVVSDETRARRQKWRDRKRLIREEMRRNRAAIVEPLAALARAGLPSTPEELLAQLDANGDGMVQKSEFVESCRNNPRLLIILGLAFGGRAVADVIDEEVANAGLGSP